MTIQGIAIETLRVGPVQANCYIVHKEDSKDCVVIDPGAEEERIQRSLVRDSLSLRAILLTHGHFDHILGANKLAALNDMKVPIYIHESDKALMEDAYLNCSAEFGMPGTASATDTFADQDELTFAGLTFRCIHTPGHTKGGACFFLQEAGVIWSGDTLFCESVGRTDFPTSSSQELIASIEERLFHLPDEVTVLCGHGEPTSIGHERKYNPYI